MADKIDTKDIVVPSDLFDKDPEDWEKADIKDIVAYLRVVRERVAEAEAANRKVTKKVAEGRADDIKKTDTGSLLDGMIGDLGVE